jgi:uncharacterized metal-binding protein YceD (DUF177 family)
MNTYIINGTQPRELENDKNSNDPRWDALKKLKNKDN